MAAVIKTRPILSDHLLRFPKGMLAERSRLIIGWPNLNCLAQDFNLFVSMVMPQFSVADILLYIGTTVIGSFKLFKIV